MRVSRLIGYLVMAAALSACATAQVSLKSPLEEQGQAWTDYYKAGDLDGLMTLYMDDAVVALHGQPALRGIPEIKAFFAQSVGKTNVDFELDYELMETHGDIAYLVSKYWLISRDPESGEVVYRDAGRSALVYKKDRDGRWKIALDIDQASPDVSFPSPEGRQ